MSFSKYWKAVLLLLIGGAWPASAAETKIDWYGYFKLDLAYDSAVSSHGNFAMWVKPHAKNKATAVTSVTARQTRVGFNLKRQEVKGNLEFDFYGAGDQEHKNHLQLRKAYVDLSVGGVRLRAGQDADLISPLVPATLNYTVGWGVGNIGYRRPQLRLYQQRGSLHWGVALARNVGADLNGDQVPDGDAGTPVVQARLALTSQVNGRPWTLGGSGHYGIMDSPGAAEKDYSTWSVNGELSLEASKKLKLLAEAYAGDNTATYFGAIFNGDSVDGTSSWGGWANLQYQASDEVNLSLGAAWDRVDEEDLAGLANARLNNRVLFGNAQYSIGPGVTAGVEVSYWTTEYANPAAGMEDCPTDLRVQFAVQGNF